MTGQLVNRARLCLLVAVIVFLAVLVGVIYD